MACAAGLLVAASSVVGIRPAQGQSIGQSLPSREQIEPPSTEAVSPAAKVAVDARLAIPPCPFAGSSLSVDLRQLRFVQADGSALPARIASLLRVVRPAPGSQPLTNLCRLRDEANQRLYDAGFVASVQIPPQEIASGEARFEVVLAKLVDVRVQGDAGPYGKTLAARISQLKALTPFNRFEAERILLLAGDVPGLDAGLGLRRAGDVPGEVAGDLVIRYSPFAVVINGQNFGSRAIGRETGTVRAEYFGLTGLSDRTFVGISSTADFDEQVTFQAGHYLGDHRGRTAGLRYSRAWSRPDVGVLDLRSRSTIAGLDFTLPLVRAVTGNLSLGGGFELINQRIDLGGGDESLPLTRDKVRVAFATLSGSTRKLNLDGSTLLSLGGSLELRRGLDLFDASKRGMIEADGSTPSRLEGNPEATVIRGGVEAVAGTGLLSLATQVQAQWANDPLLSIEEFSVGNLTLGRGYDPGITSGDRALGFRVEPRLQLPLSTVGVQLFGFYDWVRIWNLDRLAGADRATLRSWGAGTRFALPGLFLVEAMYARPTDKGLTIAGPRRASDRLLLSVTAQFPRTAR